jgi:hypothetical protein
VVRDFQKHDKNPYQASCPRCGIDDIPMNEVAVLSSCGHTGCSTCIAYAPAERETEGVCIAATSKSCDASRKDFITKCDSLGIDDTTGSLDGKYFGMKLMILVGLIRYL